MKKAICPKCGAVDFQEVVDEVDIGVGVITSLRGGDCLDCGEMSMCDNCDAWNFQEHNKWCTREVKKG